MPKSEWKPSASLERVKSRTEMYQTIRSFFQKGGVLEVETPLLGLSNSPDLNIEPFVTEMFPEKQLVLQSSPEFFMKRLLAAGSGSIYQICKAFRKGEVGSYHNPEFSLLEWYRVGWDHSALIEEVYQLLSVLLQPLPKKQITYGELFQQFLSFNPHVASLAELEAVGKLHGGEHLALDRDGWLDFLLSTVLFPQLDSNCYWVITDFPSSQAALSKLRQEHSYSVAERFEFYYNGVELANGYHELLDQNEQCERFKQEIEARKNRELQHLELDHNFLSALPHIPACAGVAIGLDRLFMLKERASNLQEVIAFPYERL